MAEVLPFQGLRYTDRPAASIADLLCPPYDVISPEGQQALLGRSPYNAVRLELPQGDVPERYARAAHDMQRWRQEGVLALEPRPSYYLLRHRFNHRGRQLERWGLTARVRLEEFSRRVILPHEGTGAAPKEDRLRLMVACHANLSPIMALYRDPQGRLRSAMKRLLETPSTATASYDGDQEVALWAVEATELESAVRTTLAEAQLFIADGHHRYETALQYRERLRQRSQGWSEQDACNYVMMTLIDFDDPGLLVLPYHRTLGGLAPPTLTAVRNRLLEVFQIRAFAHPPATPEALEEAVARDGTGVSLGLLGSDGEGPYLLTLRQGEVAQKLLGLPGGAALRDSEGWVLHQAVLEPVLGAADSYLAYTHEPREAWESVVHGRQQMAFFLKPFPLDLFQAVVSTGHRLPRKSTYFHPKLPTGLVFNPLEGEA
ncbi:MAG: DUF1015 domain-containing protein [Chloroflexota bacterium]